VTPKTEACWLRVSTYRALIVFSIVIGTSVSFAQSQRDDPAKATVPFPVIEFSSTVENLGGAARTTLTDVTFSIFRDAVGGTPIWSETQTVQPDAAGHFTVFLGITQPKGLPVELFWSGEARWIEMSAVGVLNQDRTPLVSVPYALKAGDAQTLAGHPVTDFMLAPNAGPCFVAERTQRPTIVPPCIFPPTPLQRPSGTDPSTAPQFVATASTGPGFVSQATTGPPLEVHSVSLVHNLNTDLFHGLTDAAFAKLAETNQFTLPQTLAGGLTLPATDMINGPNIGNSAHLDLQSSRLDSDSNTWLTQDFRWVASPTEGVPGSFGLLSLYFGANSVTPTSTGLSFNPDGTINFAPGQQFPSSAVMAAVYGASSGTTSTSGPTPPIVYTQSYQWNQVPQSQSGGQQGIQPGWNSVQLSPCPAGVSGSDSWHYLFISGVGTPEAVLITGGTCVSGGAYGTIEFTALYAHGIGYTLGSATGGLQEAVNTSLTASLGYVSRQVIISPGQYSLMARLSVRASNIVIVGSGASVNCMMNDTCIMLGDPSSALSFTRITLQDISIHPGIVNGTYSAIEDNANGSQMKNIAITSAGSPQFHFGYGIQVDNDQAASMDRIDMGKSGAIRCDAQFCGSAIFAPGPFRINAAVGWITNSNLDPQCAGNGVDWQSGNTLSISNTVIEAYAQFGVRAGTARGGYGNLKMDNVYEEVGGCQNPVGNIGHAGVISEGGVVRISGGVGPAGDLPCFSSNCSGLLTRYYIVPQLAGYGGSNPLGAGVALMTDTSTTLSWPQIAGASSYDILAVDNVLAWYAGSSPSGTGAFAVAVNIPQSSCSNTVCTYVDMHGARLNYTVGAPQYYPLLKYWPGNVVLGASSDTSSVWGAATLYTDNAGSGIVAELGTSRPAVFANSCDPQSAVSPLWIECQAMEYPPTSIYEEQATIMVVKPNNDGGLETNLKGRLNFGTLGSAPSHIITLSDSNFQKTIATANNRPSNDPNDAFIGYDIGNGNPAWIGLTFGAPLALSNYIGNVGDGTNWLERLTASLKTFKVPVVSPGYETSTNCISVSGACGSAPAGIVAIPVGQSSITIATTVVTAKSEIHVDENTTYGPLLSVTCDTSFGRHYQITQQVGGSGFTITTDNPPTLNPACLSFTITN
jgi:hypothetical protein